MQTIGSDTHVRVRFGLVGVGAFMRRQHVPNILRHAECRVQAVCDLDAGALAQAAAETGASLVTREAGAVFDCDAVDAVLVGTRAREHAGLVVRALERGKHVFVEKPMAMTQDEVDAVLAAARAAGRVVGVGFNRRFAPAMTAAKALFRKTRRGPAHVLYRIVDDHRVRPAYIFDMDNGGGHLLQEGSHIFDLLAWYLDAEPVEVYATGSVETDNAVVMRFDDGSTAMLLCGGRGGVFYPKELMESFCGATTIALDHFYELRYDGPAGNGLQVFALDPKTGRTVDDAGMAGYYRASFAQRPPRDLVGIHAANAFSALRVDKGHTAELEAFIRAVSADEPFSADAVAGARATVCALKAYESIRANRPVAIRPGSYGAAPASVHDGENPSGKDRLAEHVCAC